MPPPPGRRLRLLPDASTRRRRSTSMPGFSITHLPLHAAFQDPFPRPLPETTSQPARPESSTARQTSPKKPPPGQPPEPASRPSPRRSPRQSLPTRPAPPQPTPKQTQIFNQCRLRPDPAQNEQACDQRARTRYHGAQDQTVYQRHIQPPLSLRLRRRLSPSWQPTSNRPLSALHPASSRYYKP